MQKLATELLLGTEILEPLLIALPIQIAAGPPFTEMMFVEAISVRAELLENGGGAEAVLHHAADGIAEVFGEASDVASASAGFRLATFTRIRGVGGG